MATFSLEKISKNWVWIALAVTVLTSFYVSHLEDESAPAVVMPTNEISQTRKQASVMQQTAITNMSTQHLIVRDRVLKQGHANNLFRAFKNPASVVKIAPPSQQKTLNDEEFVVPPVPFRYVGKMDDSPKGSIVYLTANDKLYTVAKGEKVDAFWRFDEEFLLSLQFTYLPKNKPQVLIKNQEEQPVKNADYVQQ